MGEGGKWEKVGNVFSTSSYSYRGLAGTTCEPFQERNYELFGFLAGVRGDIPCAFGGRRGVPYDMSPEVYEQYLKSRYGYHSHSWVLLRELLDVDYDTQLTLYGTTLRVQFGDEYFEALDELKILGDPEDVRIIFWFDS